MSDCESSIEEAAAELVLHETLPYCYSICSSAAKFGIFIPKDQMELAKWKNWDDKPLVTYESRRSDLVFEGFLYENIRLVVLTMSDLLIRQKSDGKCRHYPRKQPGQEKILLNEDEEHYQFAIIMFLGTDDEFLHERPFNLKLRGTFGVHFSRNYWTLCAKIGANFTKYGMELPSGKRIKVSYNTSRKENKAMRIICGFAVYEPKLVTERVPVPNSKDKILVCKVDTFRYDDANWTDFHLFKNFGTAGVKQWLEPYWWTKFVKMDVPYPVASSTPEPTADFLLEDSMIE